MTDFRLTQRGVRRFTVRSRTSQRFDFQTDYRLLMIVNGLRKMANTLYHLKDYPIPVSVPGSATQLESHTFRRHRR